MLRASMAGLAKDASQRAKYMRYREDLVETHIVSSNHERQAFEQLILRREGIDPGEGRQHPQLRLDGACNGILLPSAMRDQFASERLWLEAVSRTSSLHSVIEQATAETRLCLVHSSRLQDTFPTEPKETQTKAGNLSHSSRIFTEVLLAQQQRRRFAWEFLSHWKRLGGLGPCRCLARNMWKTGLFLGFILRQRSFTTLGRR